MGSEALVFSGKEGGGAGALVDPLEGVYLCGEAEGLVDVAGELFAGAGGVWLAGGVEEGVPVYDLCDPEWGGWG